MKGPSRLLWLLGLSVSLARGPPSALHGKFQIRLHSFLAPNCASQHPGGALWLDVIRSETLRLRGGAKKDKDRKSVKPSIPSRAPQAEGEDYIEYEGVIPTDEISMGNDSDEWRNPDFYGSKVPPNPNKVAAGSESAARSAGPGIRSLMCIPPAG